LTPGAEGSPEKVIFPEISEVEMSKEEISSDFGVFGGPAGIRTPDLHLATTNHSFNHNPPSPYLFCPHNNFL